MLLNTLSTGANSAELAHDPQFGGLQLQPVHLPPAEHTCMQAQTSPLPAFRDNVRRSGLSRTSGLLFSAKARMCCAVSATWSCLWLQEPPIPRTMIANKAADNTLFMSYLRPSNESAPLHAAFIG
jgi:hypothetical protein